MTIELGEIRRRLEREGLLSDEREETVIAHREISDVTTDSRSISSGALFCAIRGSAGDGHAFLDRAADSGASAALVLEKNREISLAQIQVNDDRLAAAFAAAEFFDDPWNGLTMVGVTGTNGKTTSVAILRHLLSAESPAASIGTLGLVGADGAVVPGTEGLTTPGPVDIARWLRKLNDDGVRSIAMEVSSHALHQARVAAVRFDVAVFTNLTRDHLDYHRTLEDYRAAKLGLLRLLKAGGAAVVNADDPAWNDITAPTHTRVVRFGIQSRADVRAEGLSLTRDGVRWNLVTPDGSAAVDLPLYGSYNVANALGAAAALSALGWVPERIAEGLRTLPQVKGRLERVPAPEGAPVLLIDYAHTPDALERAIAAVRPLVRGRLIVVFGAGGDRDPGKRPEMGRVSAEGADISVVTSDNPRSEDPARIADEIESGMGNAPRQRILDRREAIREAIRMGSPEDVILLAGKGHETYQIWGTEKRSFDERVIVREIFAELGAGT